MHVRWRGEGLAGRAAPGFWNRVVVRVVVRDLKERKNVYFFKSPTTTRTTTQFQSPGRPCRACHHGAIVKNTLGLQGVVVSWPGRLAVACVGQSALWATGLTCDLCRPTPVTIN